MELNLLKPHQKLAIYMEGASNLDLGKMGFGVLRYSPNEVVAVVDSERAGTDMKDTGRSPRSVPVVADVAQAREMGADVLVLGTAPPGGLIPETWIPALDQAVELGFSLINGLHDLLSPRYRSLRPEQWVWDVRVEPEGLATGTGLAANLANQRILLVGTDMAIGKMTAGLELWKGLKEAGKNAAFVATGQIGITVTGEGIPLDAIKVDYAAGAVESEVLRHRDAEYIVIEGQGSLLHPASTSTLPLIRGGCPTHLILCHRAGQDTLRSDPTIKTPPLKEFIKLCEDVASVCGSFSRPKTIGVSLITAHLTPEEAAMAVEEVETETGLPCTDPVRYGVDKLIKALI